MLTAFFFFNDTATTEIYTLSLHDALPISTPPPRWSRSRGASSIGCTRSRRGNRPPATARCSASSRICWRRSRASRKSRCSRTRDRKSTRLNSSHGYISYAVFCLKKKIIPNPIQAYIRNLIAPITSSAVVYHVTCLRDDSQGVRHLSRYTIIFLRYLVGIMDTIYL